MRTFWSMSFTGEVWNLFSYLSLYYIEIESPYPNYSMYPLRRSEYNLMICCNLSMFWTLLATYWLSMLLWRASFSIRLNPIQYTIEWHSLYDWIRFGMPLFVESVSFVNNAADCRSILFPVHNRSGKKRRRRVWYGLE